MKWTGRLAQILNLVAIALLLWGLFPFSQRAFLLPLLLAWPWLTLLVVALLQPGVRFGGDMDKDLSLSLFLPGMALAFQAAMAPHALHLLGPSLLALAGALLLLLAVAAVDPTIRQTPPSLASLGVLLLAYGYGVGMQLDESWDHAPVTRYPVPILEKRIAGRRRDHRLLKIGPWGDVRNSSEEAVLGWFYAQVQVGDSVCVVVHPGALRVPWYDLALCEKNPSTATTP